MRDLFLKSRRNQGSRAAQNHSAYTRSLFYKLRELYPVVIPDGVKVIEEGAFENCVGLLNVTLPNSVEEMGERAFYGCDNLTRITILDARNLLKIFNLMFNRDESEKVSRSAEFQFLRRYVRESCFDEESACDPVAISMDGLLPPSKPRRRRDVL